MMRQLSRHEIIIHRLITFPVLITLFTAGNAAFYTRADDQQQRFINAVMDLFGMYQLNKICVLLWRNRNQFAKQKYLILSALLM